MNDTTESYWLLSLINFHPSNFPLSQLKHRLTTLNSPVNDFMSLCNGNGRNHRIMLQMKTSHYRTVNIQTSSTMKYKTINIKESHRNIRRRFGRGEVSGRVLLLSYLILPLPSLPIHTSKNTHSQ